MSELSDVLNKWSIEIGDCRVDVDTMYQEPISDCVVELADALAASQREVERLRWYAEFVVETDRGAEFDEWVEPLREGSE